MKVAEALCFESHTMKKQKKVVIKSSVLEKNRANFSENISLNHR